MCAARQRLSANAWWASYLIILPVPVVRVFVPKDHQTESVLLPVRARRPGGIIGRHSDNLESGPAKASPHVLLFIKSTPLRAQSASSDRKTEVGTVVGLPAGITELHVTSQSVVSNWPCGTPPAGACAHASAALSSLSLPFVEVARTHGGVCSVERYGTVYMAMSSGSRH